MCFVKMEKENCVGKNWGAKSFSHLLSVEIWYLIWKLKWYLDHRLKIKFALSLTSIVQTEVL
jgi:hypothetical protein